MSRAYAGTVECTVHDCPVPAHYIEVTTTPDRYVCQGHALMMISGGGRTEPLPKEDESLAVLRAATGEEETDG